MCMCVSHGLTEARVSCSVVVHIIDLRQDFSLNLELGWSLESLTGLVSDLYSVVVRGLCDDHTQLLTWLLETGITVLILGKWALSPAEPSP